MASSRKPPPKPDPADSALLSAVQRAVAAGPAFGAPPRSLPADGPLPPRRRIPGPADGAGLLIAYSGGIDSTVLLDLAARLRDANAPGFARLHAAHIHHGLQPEADDWTEHCMAQCARRGIACVVKRVKVTEGRGVEDGARTARYAALLAAAREVGAVAVLTAHHADDRLETFLLQWLRGAGPAGLAGIAGQRDLHRAQVADASADAVADGSSDSRTDSSAESRTGSRADLRAAAHATAQFAAQADANTVADTETHSAANAATGTVQVLRPLLAVTRRELQQYAQRHGLEVVEDPSNADPRYARNALRLHVLPALARIRSGFARSAARSIDLVAEAADVLDELAQEGLHRCTDGAPAGMLRLDRLAALPPARRALVLRAWLAGQGVEAPSRARLGEALDQALNGRADSRMLIRIGRRELRRHGGLLCLRVPGQAARLREVLHWSGEPELPVGNWGGVLRFVAADGPGFDAGWLRERPLELRGRTGGERLKPHASRPSKRLKHLYQEAGVPEFERSALPLLWRDDRLIFVARVGADARLLDSGPGRVRIEWQGETLLLPE
jgi:tRNA(Ile)-lysidine synthase